jgi:hypothetical protein
MTRPIPGAEPEPALEALKMPKIIDYWRGLVADVKEAESNSAEHLRAVGDLWYPVLRMRILAAAHDGAQRKLGPCDLPAAHAEQVAKRVWNDLVAALHKRAVPEAWSDYAAVIAVARPWIANRLNVPVADVRGAIQRLDASKLEDLSLDAFCALYPEPMSSRDEQVTKGAITAWLLQDRPWPDLGTWVPFTLYSLTARYFEQGYYLGPKICSSESEILDLVEAAPYGAEWARSVVRKRAQSRTVESYLGVLNAILAREAPEPGGSLVSRRLTLVEWLSNPEARLTRMVEVQGAATSEAVVRRAFAEDERGMMLQMLSAANGQSEYPEDMSDQQRRAALERLVEAMEALPLRTELIVQVAERGGKRGSAWARAVIEARAPKSLKTHQMTLMNAVAKRQDTRTLLAPAQRNKTWRSLHRTLEVAARPDAGIQLATV